MVINGIWTVVLMLHIILAVRTKLYNIYGIIIIISATERKKTATLVNEEMRYNTEVESDGLHDGRRTLHQMEHEGQMRRF